MFAHSFRNIPRFHAALISFPRYILILQHICPLLSVIFGVVLILNVILSSATSNIIDLEDFCGCLRIISFISVGPSSVTGFISTRRNVNKAIINTIIKKH